MSSQTNHHKGFPWGHVVGFAMSLILTFAALFLVLYTSLPALTIVAIITGLAVLQAGLQLFMFMHMTESENAKIQTGTMAYSFFIAVTIVAGTVWIVFAM
ncbi:cytochrome aa3 quinol oxidase subunit IV [Bacillus sp. 165]|uniref:cytochrome aa3 quinol oxidase subunit IV n=1 Tax=Bacillus sp. 165 TaxID=1529117 RepID=UPI001ADAEE33|nr:cytochrome aa3 quinol oxidase subunit IV [Bacillus sp. 165]MBO9131173.1 cytochrome aa3 quinol oxidase subunit IV [Bacillus sp. 165]